jgi:hypothetical protein
VHCPSIAYLVGKIFWKNFLRLVGWFLGAAIYQPTNLKKKPLEVFDFYMGK